MPLQPGGETEGPEEEGSGAMPRKALSLETLALHSFLVFLEKECAMLVTLYLRESPLWRNARERLLAALKEMVNDRVRGKNAGTVRRKLFSGIVSGRFPSPELRNGHCGAARKRPNQQFLAGDDDDEEGQARNDVEKMKHFGRKCSSPCCAGAFLVEAMLSVIVHEDLEDISFPDDLRGTVYKRKAIRKFLFIDMPSVLYHYIQRLDSLPDSSTPPALSRLSLGANLGSLDTQLVNEGILRSRVETRRYYDFPWRFSNRHSRASTDFMMRTLCALFSRPADYFSRLTVIRLNSECLNTRLSVVADRGGHAAVQLMAGIAYSCPALETLDLAQVSSLSPECLLYLFYQDAFSLLHKYMYLPDYEMDPDGSFHFERHPETIHMHGVPAASYCPWCDDPAAPNQVRDGCEFYMLQTIHILDDRLYDFVERHRGEEFVRSLPDHEPSGYVAGHYLAFCVKVSHLLAAFKDPLLELKRPPDEEGACREWELSFPDKGQACEYVKKSTDGVETKSSLCSSLRKLLLPLDVVDSKTWVVPLALKAAPQLNSLGDCFAYEGLKLAEDLQLGLEQPTELEEINMCFEDFTSFKVKERIIRRLKSLLARHTHWSIFSGQVAFGEFSLKNWVENELGEVIDMSDLAAIKACWREQVESVVVKCPLLRSIKVSIQSSVLCTGDKSMWERLNDLANLSELYVYSSCWADVLGLLETVGGKVRRLSLMLNSPKSMREDDIASMEFVNTIPYLCPQLEEVCLGYLQGEVPHSLCANPRYNSGNSYSRLTAFEATGNITLEALQFLWARAKLLKKLKVSGSIVSFTAGPVPGGAASPAASASEVVLNRERILHLFDLNPMAHLEELEVNMTLGSISAAQTLLQALPDNIRSVSTLNVKVSIPESLEGENFGDLVSSVLARMASFKSECLARSGEVVWNWKREGILTILLQQQMLLSFSDLIDP